jgi:hypothetical protein
MLTLVLVVLTACDIEESRPDYSPIQNTLPAGGMLIDWDEENVHLNIEDVMKGLDEKSKAVFSKSIDWFATESEMGFEYLDGKTAKQAVDIINCLKKAPPDKQKGCLE